MLKILYIYISRDDKNKIKLGAPDKPLALVYRNRCIPIPNRAVFEVSDHDMYIKTYLTPSVMAKIKCPENKSNILSNFYDSETIWILKEGVLYLLSSF